MSLDERKQTVQTGYDSLSPRFSDWMEAVEGDPWERFVGELGSRLEDGARVLDLGCGSGVPKTSRLAERFDVLGVDLSEEQVRRARENLPQASFVQGDLAALDFADATFDAVTALYSLTHVPREEHAALFARIARWLRAGGLFLATHGAKVSDDWTGDWLGVDMFFSSHDADTNRRLLREAGFTLLLDELVTMREPEPQGDATFLWVLARKRA